MSGALGLLGWAWLDPRFRDAEGLLDGSFCLPLAASFASLLLGLSAGGPLARSARWLALAMVGQAIGLQLVEAGSLVGYQHYRTFPDLLSDAPGRILLALFATQGLLVALGWTRIWERARAAFPRILSRGGWVVVGLVFTLTSATLSREATRYVSELGFATLVQVVNVANLVLIVAAISRRELSELGRKLGNLLDREDSRAVSGIDRFALLCAAWAMAVPVLLCLLSYERHPHVPDELPYLHHARYVAEGLLSLPIPAVPEAFDVDLMHYEDDRWFSPVPPGWPAVLAVGAWLGAPWLVNTILNGVIVLLAYVLVRRLYDGAAARLTLLLLCASPWFLFMGSNFMGHTSALAFALTAALAAAKLRETRRLAWAWLGGCAAGVTSLIRPLEGLAVAMLLGAWTLGVSGRRFRFAPVALIVLGAVIVGGLVLPYNYLMTGDPTYAPIMAYVDTYYEPGSMDLGFGPNRGLGWTGLDPLPGHGAADVLINANLNLYSVNVELFGWGTGSLILLAFGVCSGALRRTDWLMVVAIASVAGVHSFFWFSGGPDFGARYWYLILPACIVLTVRGAEILGQRLQPVAPGLATSGVRVGVLALCLLALLTFVPWRAIDKYHHYRDMRPGIRVLTREHAFGKSLVLIRGRRHPDYASAMAYNPLDFDSDAPLFAWDRGPEIRVRLAEAYPDRPVWIVDGPSVTNADFRLVAGPLPPEEFAAMALGLSDTLPEGRERP